MAEATAGSVSKVECVLTFRDVGEVKVALYRHLAPLTVNAVLRAIPVYSRVNLQSGMLNLFTEIKVGVEKGRNQFVRGDVAFLPSGGLLCFFLKPAKSDRPLNPVGTAEGPLELLDNAKLGAVATLKLAPGQVPPADVV